MIQKKDNPIPYKCTECKFTVTQYYDTKLYALHTVLVFTTDYYSIFYR